MLTVDKSTADGLSVVKDLSAKDEAKEYKTPYEAYYKRQRERAHVTMTA